MSEEEIRARMQHLSDEERQHLDDLTCMSDLTLHCEVGHHEVTVPKVAGKGASGRPPTKCWGEAHTVVPLPPSETGIVVCAKHAAMLPAPNKEVDQ